MYICLLPNKVLAVNDPKTLETLIAIEHAFMLLSCCFLRRARTYHLYRRCVLSPLSLHSYGRDGEYRSSTMPLYTHTLLITLVLVVMI